MKRAVVLAVVAALMVLAVSVSANTPKHHTWLICNNGARYTHTPTTCRLRIRGGRTVSMRRLLWRHWGARLTIAHGTSSGNRVRVAARDRTKVTNCVGLHRTDWFYEKVTLRIKGKKRHVIGSSLKPQCNNP